jgi:ABC-type nitrate/sulfonate/bicarbonate transport system substrate-binding protein
MASDRATGGPLLTRRTVTRALGTSMLSAACAGGARAQTMPIILKVGTPVGAIPGVKTAIEEGYFRDEGIVAQLVTLAGGPNILAALAGGSLDVGYSDLFAWVGSLEHGFELEYLQGANGRGNVDYIIASAQSGIKAPADLRGKKIGVAAHAQSRLRVILYLERFGLKSSDVSFVIINQRDTVGAALSAGQIDAAIAPDPDVAVWERQYHVLPLQGRPWEQVPAGAATAAFFAANKWLAGNPKVAEGFVRAARKGASHYNAMSADRKAQLALKYDKLDLFAIDKEAPGVLERLNDDHAAIDGPIDVEATTRWLEIAKEHGVINNVQALKDHVDPMAFALHV